MFSYFTWKYLLLFHWIVVLFSRSSALLQILSYCNSHRQNFMYLHWNIVIEVTAENCFIISYLTILATDECASNTTNACHINADCTDTDGSYTCTCKDGCTGDGFICSFKWSLICFFVKWYALVLCVHVFGSCIIR